MNELFFGINANEQGFLPTANGDENTIALQKAVENGGTIFVSQPGVYEISGTVVLCSNTTLIFGAGVTLKRVVNQEGEHVGAHFFINEGAFTRVYDENIKIIGLHICCNGFESIKNAKIVGLRGQVAFFYIKKLLIRDFVCMDLCKVSFCIHVCTFDDVVIENVHIEGQKDAVHFGKGNNFVVRHGMFKTYDDPIALNAHDYTTSNPQLGWIENGLIEDCYDLQDDATVGFFCRILAGSWVDWFEGMEVRQSDTVIHNGKMYRVSMKVDGKSFISTTPPTHESGIKEYDGINWVMTQDDDLPYNCGCRNIKLQNIHLQKVRDIALSIHFDDDKFSHSCYPNSTPPVQENITLDTIYMENTVEKLVSVLTPINTMKIINSDLKGTYLYFCEKVCVKSEQTTALTLVGNTFENCPEEFVVVEDGRKVFVEKVACHTL